MSNNLVIGICGKIGSGKTTLANYLSEYYKCTKFNLGDYVRWEAKKVGLSIDRPSLQKLGKELMDGDIVHFCKESLTFSKWDRSSNLIIAGIRRKSQVDTFKKLVHPNKFLLIYVDVKEEIRKERVLQRSADEHSPDIDKHQTEEEVKYVLAEISDIIVDSSMPINKLTEDTLDKINEILKGGKLIGS